MAQLQGRGGVEQSSHHGAPIKDVLGPEVDLRWTSVCVLQRGQLCATVNAVGVSFPHYTF